ncbi:MAG: hypothetical protein NTU83_05595 [Candidatus Hydrogenedentes bacterium]|nr:hypothetical protein [Candidatus Hydrogenedentota bacterium]
MNPTRTAKKGVPNPDDVTYDRMRQVIAALCHDFRLPDPERVLT